MRRQATAGRLIRDQYPVIQVRPEWGLGNEDMGTKSKFWYRVPSQDTRWLFKYPRRNSGEHWTEKIAAEIARMLDIPHARVSESATGSDGGTPWRRHLIMRRRWAGSSGTRGGVCY